MLPHPDIEEIDVRLPDRFPLLREILKQTQRLGVTSVESLQKLLSGIPPLRHFSQKSVNTEEEMWSFLHDLSDPSIFAQLFNVLQAQTAPVSTPVPSDIRVQGFKQSVYTTVPGFNCVELLLQNILKSSEEFKNHRNSYYSPVLHIFQSSGYGKSRTTFEVADFIDEVFICCRSSEIETGEPTRSLRIVDFIQETLPNTTFSWALFILTFLIIRRKDSMRMDRNWIQSLFQDKANQINFWDKAIHLYTNIATLYKHDVDKLSSLNVHAEEVSIGNLLLDIFSRFNLPEDDPFFLDYTVFIEKHPTLTGIPLGETEKKNNASDLPLFLFVLDEASHVLLPIVEGTQCKPLLFFRRALRAVSIHFQIFALTLDTNSKISNYMPQPKTDQSGRLATRQYKLFEPYFLFPLQVSLVNPSNFPLLDYHFNEGIGADTIEITVRFNPAYLLLYSRALFSAHFNEYRSKGIKVRQGLQLIIEMAKTKLLNYNRIEDKVAITTAPSSAMFAVLASQLYIMTTVIPFKELLVYQHLATFNGFTTEHHDDIRSEYPSEPLVSEAAMQSIKDSESFSCCLQTLKLTVPEILSLNSGGKGEIGELIASIILLRCFCLTSSLFLEANDDILSRPIPLVLFLKTLLRDHPTSAYFFESFSKGGGDLFLRSLVQFNHYIKVEHDLQPSDLIFYYKRFAAICCRSGATGIDIVIPVAIPTSVANPIIIDDSSTFRMSAFSIQVKNTTSSLNMNHLVDQYMKNPLAKLIGFSHGSPEQLFLIMNVNQGNLTGIFRQWKRAGKAKQETETIVDDTTENPIQEFRLHCKFDETGKMVPTNHPGGSRGAKEYKKLKRFYVLQLCDQFSYPGGFLNAEQRKLLLSIRDFNWRKDALVPLLRQIGVEDMQIKTILDNRDPGKRWLETSLPVTEYEGREKANA